jgi:hypothetical protein
MKAYLVYEVHELTDEAFEIFLFEEDAQDRLEQLRNIGIFNYDEVEFDWLPRVLEDSIGVRAKDGRL